ncbi:MAG: 2-hydroxyacyl-CoA dehydratase [Desulfobacteraceae bacterium]|nr:2-hydroxyacyl-CoA dehydratase [Desulfobacteraceae bacterium]MBC2755383.1 2-hydroxyacyl-CoA dehydratase [Desulfobacteraceae bacterium]
MKIDITKKLAQLKNDGRKVLGCFPLYPPLELFYAMDLVPVVLWGLRGTATDTTESDRHLQNYTCSVARHLTEFALSNGSGLLDGLFMYNACDTLRNLPEIIEKEWEKIGQALPLIKVHIPMVLPAQTDATAYFKNEINHLIKDLEERFDVLFSKDKFVQAVKQIKYVRDLMARAENRVTDGHLSFLNFVDAIHECWFSTVEEQIRILESLIDELSDEPAFSADKDSRHGVILSGILPPPTSVIHAIESSGLRIVGNDIASLGRSYASMPETREDPAAYFLDFYYQHFPCPTLLYTGDRRTTSLLGLVDKTGAKGVIFVGEKFCEYEYFEFPHLVQQLKDKGIQTLEIEIAIEDDAQTSAHDSRVSAFSEILKNNF